MIYIVDDDADARDALAWLLRTRRLVSESFGSGDAFCAALAARLRIVEPSCLVLDIRMPGKSGTTVFAELTELGLNEVLPTIFLTGNADVATAVNLVKSGAFDFCEKPLSNNALVDRIEAALRHSEAAVAARDVRGERARLLADLTEREREVMNLILEGLPNKLVADQLGISMRTVEVHRARVFDKLGLRSAVDLANWLNQDR
jgi:two-component system, LuxR family, response regulator DctR